MTLPFPIQFASRGPQSPWFDAAAYVDLAAIADFNNNQYALPALGPEAVTNGNFANGLTGWSQIGLGGTVTVSGGEVTITGGTSPGIRQNTLTRGALYYVTIRARRTAGTAAIFGAGLSFSGISSSMQTFSGYFTPIDNNFDFGLSGDASTSNVIFSDISFKEVILTRNAVALGPNLAASGYTMSVNGGTGTATESPTGQLNLTGDGTNPATGDKSFTTVVGGRYRFIYNATQSVRAYIGTSAGGSQITPNTAGAVGFNSLEFTATTTTTWVRFQRTTASLSTVTTIEIRELPAIGSYPKRSATFAEWFAFTAASDTARSYVDQSGTWRNSAYGVTNLVTWSNNQSNAVWTISGGSSVGSPVISLTGNMDAYPLTFSASSASGLVQNLTGVTSSTVYTASVWVRCVSGTELVRIKVWDNTSDKFSSNFTVTTDWQRVSFTLTTGTTNPTSPNIEIRNASDGLARTVQVYQLQLEPGSAATAPLVTTANAVFGGVNAPRFDYRNSKRQFRLEDARTNSIRNNSMSGAVAGSPGTLPTWWAWDNALPVGMTKSISNTGTENGLPYVDVTISGTAGAAGYEALTFTTSGLTAMSAGQTWTASSFFRTVSGVIPAGSSLYMRYETSVGATTQDSAVSIALLSSAFQRVSTTNTNAPATTANGRSFLLWSFANGLTYNFTLRIYAPQMELGAFASDPILTAGTSVTRAIETARFSPLLEAVMQRAAASVVVRGRLDAAASNNMRMVGSSGQVAIAYAISSSVTVGTYNATTALATSLGSGSSNLAIGVAAGFDSAGRAVVGNAGTVVADNLSVGTRLAVYLGRAETVPVNEYGFGNYDFVGISPERLNDSTLQALAVAA